MDELEEKKNYLLQKYRKQKPKLEDYKKFGVFWRPLNQDVFGWKLLCKCDNEEQALAEIQWRLEFCKNPTNRDLPLENDKRFNTFKDETKNLDENGVEVSCYDPNFRNLKFYSEIELNYSGEYIILPVYEVFE